MKNLKFEIGLWFSTHTILAKYPKWFGDLMLGWAFGH